MPDCIATTFSHVKPGDTPFVPGGLRDFFLYRYLGIAKATNNQVIAHLMKANTAPESGTGWHRHEAHFQIVIMVKGWARFKYATRKRWSRPATWCTSAPGISHCLFDCSPDMEYLEIVSPADFKSIDVEPVCPIPAPTPWTS